ncbi:unnamed protein product [Moneuplotes crassus]|uniref:Uncharacterized protein n=1 Tax=Euplotes crassus TaxID=5936 RepID=A0AAD1UNH4_EUPCR|nr:unnamed protein product [Moneuplotes crassus]
MKIYLAITFIMMLLMTSLAQIAQNEDKMAALNEEAEALAASSSCGFVELTICGYVMSSGDYHFCQIQSVCTCCGTLPGQTCYGHCDF